MSRREVIFKENLIMSKKPIGNPNHLPEKTAKEIEEDFLKLIASLIMKIIKEETENPHSQDTQQEPIED